MSKTTSIAMVIAVTITFCYAFMQINNAEKENNIAPTISHTFEFNGKHCTRRIFLRSGIKEVGSFMECDGSIINYSAGE